MPLSKSRNKGIQQSAAHCSYCFALTTQAGQSLCLSQWKETFTSQGDISLNKGQTPAAHDLLPNSAQGRTNEQLLVVCLQVPLAEPLADTAKVPSSDGSSVSNEVPDEWEIKPEELKLGPRIGFGSFGEVYRGSWRYTDVAVKKLIDQELSPSLLEVLSMMPLPIELNNCQVKRSVVFSINKNDR